MVGSLVTSNLNQQPWNSIDEILILVRKCKSQLEVNQLHARMITTGFIRKPSFTTRLILSLTSSSSITPLVDFARFIFFTRHPFDNNSSEFEDGNDPFDPFLWNAIIKTYSHGDDPLEALFLFSLMLDNGVVVDKFTLSLVLKACSRLALVNEGMQIHGFLIKFDLGSDVYLQNCLISLYIRCVSIGFARQVFDRFVNRDSVSYNSMIDGYVKHGEIELAREVFDSMPVEQRNLISWNSLISGYAQSEVGVEAAYELFEKMPERDLFSWNSIIDGCLKSGRMDEAQALFDRMPEKDTVTWANMIDGYAKHGRINEAAKLFQEMTQKDVIVYNAMMSGYVQSGDCMEALDVFYGMQIDGSLSPDRTTLVIALSAIAQLGHIEKGILVHCYAIENNFSVDGRLGVALIDMYAKCGCIEDAVLVFEKIKVKGVDHWNAMIGGLAIHGFGEMAFNLLMELGKTSLKPDDITFIGLLNACGHAGLVKEGIICFELMRRVHKLEPKLQHYGCMVDILSRAGHVEEAMKFVEAMPIVPNDVIWRTLLSACKSHETFSIGESLAKHLIRLDSASSSPYVLLSNIYAGVHMWNDVNRVRTTMKRRNLNKVPGCSWIKLEGNVHEFFVQDKSHPQAIQIYSLLDKTPESEVNYCENYNSSGRIVRFDG